MGSGKWGVGSGQWEVGSGQWGVGRGLGVVMSDEIRTFRDLRVWQRGMALVTEVYRLSKQFPKEEVYALASQMRRAAVSVPSNIAEGYGRHSTTDYVRFLRMASGSLYELQTQTEIARNLGYVDESTLNDLASAGDEIARMLSALIRTLEDGKATPATPKTRSRA